jgi:hypothetical protein
MKKLISLTFTVLIGIGCAAHRANVGGGPAAPVTTWEQVNYDNLQIAVHNRAVAKAVTAAQQNGFLETEYYDIISREGANITRVHQQLTPLLQTESTIKANSDKIKALLDAMVGSAKAIADAAAVKNPQAKQELISEAQLIGSLANTILSLLKDNGVFVKGCPSPDDPPCLNTNGNTLVVERSPR